MVVMRSLFVDTNSSWPQILLCNWQCSKNLWGNYFVVILTQMFSSYTIIIWRLWLLLQAPWGATPCSIYRFCNLIGLYHILGIDQTNLTSFTRLFLVSPGLPSLQFFLSLAVCITTASDQNWRQGRPRNEATFLVGDSHRLSTRWV